MEWWKDKQMKPSVEVGELEPVSDDNGTWYIDENGNLQYAANDESVPEGATVLSFDEAKKYAKDNNITWSYLINLLMNNIEFYIGQSIDVTLALMEGYTVEIGWLLSNDGKTGEEFISYGEARGVEASAGWNFFILIPKDNFKLYDFEGLSHTFVGNVLWFSPSFSGNSTEHSIRNSVGDTYYVIKVGVGPGVGGSESKTNTSFIHWLQNIDYSNFHWH